MTYFGRLRTLVQMSHGTTASGALGCNRSCSSSLSWSRRNHHIGKRGGGNGIKLTFRSHPVAYSTRGPMGLPTGSNTSTKHRTR